MIRCRNIFEAIEMRDMRGIEKHLGKCFSLLRKNHEGRTPLHVAASCGFIEIVNFFIASGADINTRDISGWTPLHTSVSQNSADLAEVFLDSGADPNAMDRNGYTPLHLAFSGRMVRLLLRYGADPGLTNIHGTTAEEQIGRLCGDDATSEILSHRAVFSTQTRRRRTIRSRKIA